MLNDKQARIEQSKPTDFTLGNFPKGSVINMTLHDFVENLFTGESPQPTYEGSVITEIDGNVTYNSETGILTINAAEGIQDLSRIGFNTNATVGTLYNVTSSAKTKQFARLVTSDLAESVWIENGRLIAGQWIPSTNTFIPFSGLAVKKDNVLIASNVSVINLIGGIECVYNDVTGQLQLSFPPLQVAHSYSELVTTMTGLATPGQDFIVTQGNGKLLRVHAQTSTELDGFAWNITDQKLGKYTLSTDTFVPFDSVINWSSVTGGDPSDNTELTDYITQLIEDADLTGEQGDPGTPGTNGTNGTNGWTPSLALESYTLGSLQRVVVKLVGYFGGTGTTPTSNVGFYLSTAGYISNRDLAVNIRGTDGTFGEDGTISWSSITGGEPSDNTALTDYINELIGGGGGVGTDGKSFLVGTTVPSSGLGNNGDSYMRLSTGIVYTKSSGSWTSTGFSLKGTDGTSGSNGTDGTDGLNGEMTRSSDDSINTTGSIVTLNFTVPFTNSGWIVGSRLRGTLQSTPSKFFEGPITVLSDTFVKVAVDLVDISGGGVGAGWDLALTGEKGVDGTAMPGTPGADGAPAVMTRTSTSTISIVSLASTATLAFTAVTALGWLVGTRLRFYSTGSGAWQEGPITSLTSTSVTVTVDAVSGSGSHSDWNIVVAGEKGNTGSTGTNGSNGLNADMTRTSSTSRTVASSGSFSFTFTTSSSNLGWLIGSYLRAASSASPTNYVEGTVTAVSSTAVTISVSASGGSGTFADWNIFIAGQAGGGGGGTVGPGTANTVPYFNSTSTVASTAMVTDATGTYFGVGTTASSSANLSLLSTTSIALMRFVAGVLKTTLGTGEWDYTTGIGRFAASLFCLVDGSVSQPALAIGATYATKIGLYVASAGMAFTVGSVRRMFISSAGVLTVDNLAGTGTRQMTADSSGTVQALLTLQDLCLYSNSGEVTGITTSELTTLSVTPAVGNATLVAGLFAANKTLELVSFGSFTTASTGNITFRFKLGGTTVSTLVIPVAASNGSYTLRFYIRVISVSGGNASVRVTAAGAANNGSAINNGSITINSYATTTTAMLLTAQCDSGITLVVDEVNLLQRN